MSSQRYQSKLFDYDKCGNQSTVRDEYSAQHRQFNGFNQLTQLSHNGRYNHYDYDALGRRSRKTTEQSTFDFLWDGDQLIGEHCQGQYRWYIYAPNDFTPLALFDNGALYFYHTDHLGTPHTVTDSEGGVVWQATYNALGYAFISIDIIHNPLRFQGQYHDQESGLHYNRFRYYDPSIGQFIHQDPIGLLGGINHYRYAPNPIQWVDPLGLSCKEGGDNFLLNSAYLVGGVTKYFGDTVTGTAEAIYADPLAVAWDALSTTVDAAYYPIDIATRPFGITTHAVDRTNARINDALDAAQELKANTVVNWECRNWEGMGSNMAAIGMVVNPRAIIKKNVASRNSYLDEGAALLLNKKSDEYAKLVNANKVWSWEDFSEGASLTIKQKREIRIDAINRGLIPDVAFKEGTKYPDFELAGLIKKVDELPPELWKQSDYKQFKWLDNRVSGGRPDGYTWHHSKITQR